MLALSLRLRAVGPGLRASVVCKRGPLPVRLRCLCEAPKPEGKVPKGFGSFFRHKPRSSGDSAAPKPTKGGSSSAGSAGGGAGGRGSNGSSSESGGSSKAEGGGSGGSGGSSGGGNAGGGSASPDGPGGDGGFGAGSPVPLVLGVLATAVWSYPLLFPSRQDAQEITFADFRRELLETGTVDRIVIVNKSKARVYMRTTQGPPGSRVVVPQSQAQYWFSLGSVNGFEKKLEHAQADIGVAARDFLPVTYESEMFLSSELLKIAPTLLLIGFWLMMMRGGGLGSFMGGGGGGGGGGRNIFQVGKSKPTIISKEKKTGVLFKDVAGLAEAKVEVMEVVDFLKNPKRYEQLGAKIPKGALLVGPPGTGKTLLAKATAGEANVPFLSVSGSDFIEMFVGVGPSRVRDLFAQAKSMQPCIIWIDEIDAVGRARGRGGMVGGNDERENTLNQLLVEMDGFSSTGQIVVMAGTNRPDTLDQALLRPGRFDRTIEVASPDISGRAEIFRVHLPQLRLVDDVKELSEKLASLSPGFSGAEIANVCNEAALHAARTSKDAVGLDDFHAAMDRVIGGLEQRSKVLTIEEKTRVAHHEAGHAVAGWFLQHAAPLLKVSIVPRGMAALGYAQYVPKEKKLYTKAQMMDTMCMMLGGRIAEDLFFEQVSTGAQDDLRKVTRLAYSIVTLYGMNERVGHMSFPPSDGQMSTQRPYSEARAELVDSEVRELVAAAYERTVTLLTSKKELARQLAALLLEKEVIHREDVVRVLGERQWKEAATYEELAAGLGNSTPEEAAVEPKPS